MGFVCGVLQCVMVVECANYAGDQKYCVPLRVIV